MIYFRGCLSREKLKKIPEATERLLKIAGIDYKILDNEGCCGSVLLRTGFYDDALHVMRDTLNDLNGEKVLVSCAGCYRTFKQDYPEIFGEKVDVIHTSQLFHELIKEGKIKPEETQEKVTYHDPCHLGRHMGEYRIPRQVISHNAKLVEMKHNHEKSRCCGAGGGVRSAFPELSKEIGRIRLDEAKDTLARCLITCCPFCISNLEFAQENSVVNEINIMDLSQFLLRRLSHE